MSVICTCCHCGEQFKGAQDKCRQFCSMCSTAESRKKIDIENAKIKQENIAKGFKYAN